MSKPDLNRANEELSRRTEDSNIHTATDRGLVYRLPHLDTPTSNSSLTPHSRNKIVKVMTQVIGYIYRPKNAIRRDDNYRNPRA